MKVKVKEFVKATEPAMTLDPVEEIIANRESIKRCMERIERLQRNLERENANLCAMGNTEKALIAELKEYQSGPSWTIKGISNGAIMASLEDE